MQCTLWQRMGSYEYEAAQDYDQRGRPIGSMYYTGWCRCVGGRLANGHWPQWNDHTGEQR